MRTRRLSICLGIFIAVVTIQSCSAPAKTGPFDRIDPVKVSPAKFKILLENEHVRVVEYILKPGEKDDWHTHPAKTSYVVSGGNLKIRLENGEEINVEEKTGTAAWMNELGKHYAENVGETDIRHTPNGDQGFTIGPLLELSALPFRSTT